MTSGAPLTSLARPSGNITGVFPQQIELAKKRLQIFKEALPDLQTSTMFWDGSSEDQWKATSATAGEFGLRLMPETVRASTGVDWATAACTTREPQLVLQFVRIAGGLANLRLKIRWFTYLC